MAIVFASQPSAQNVTVGDNWTLAASVTGEAIASFANKVLPNTDLEVCYCLVADSSENIYVGSGFTASTDSTLFKSTDKGDTWSTVFSDTTSDSSGVPSAVITPSGVVVSAVTNYATGLVRIYKDGVFTTSFAGAGNVSTTAFAMHAFANGNIVVGVGDATSGGGAIRVSTNGGASFDLAYTGIVASTGRMISVCGIDSTTAIMTDLSGYVYRTTNSGSTWSQVGQIDNSFGVYPVGLLGSRLIAWNQVANTWFQSANNGTTWISFVGTTPPFGTYNKIRKFGNVTIFGEHTGRRIAVNVGDTTWTTYTLPDASIGRVYDAVISGKNFYCATGSAVGYGRVYRSTFSTDFKLYKTPSTLINSSTETDGDYSYSDIGDASDIGDYYITATNSGTTIQSNNVAVNVFNKLHIYSITPTSINAAAGTVVPISCEASGGQGQPTSLLTNSVIGGATISPRLNGFSTPTPMNYLVSNTTTKKFGNSSLQILKTHATANIYGNLVGFEVPITFSGNLTIEFWMKKSQHLDGNCDFCRFGIPNLSGYLQLERQAYNNITIQGISGIGAILSPATSILGLWNHWCIEITSTTFKIYLNGVLRTSSTTTRPTNGSGYVGFNYQSTHSEQNEWLYDDIRISNNIRYGTNFTPPTTEYSTDSNTLVVANFNTVNTNPTYTKTLIDTSDSSIISNTLPYNYTANSADNKKTFELSVSDGFTTKSNLINVNIHDVNQTSNYGEFAWIF